MGSWGVACHAARCAMIVRNSNDLPCHVVSLMLAGLQSRGDNASGRSSSLPRRSASPLRLMSGRLSPSFPSPATPSATLGLPLHHILASCPAPLRIPDRPSRLLTRLPRPAPLIPPASSPWSSRPRAYPVPLLTLHGPRAPLPPQGTRRALPGRASARLGAARCTRRCCVPAWRPESAQTAAMTSWVATFRRSTCAQAQTSTRLLVSLPIDQSITTCTSLCWCITSSNET